MQDIMAVRHGGAGSESGGSSAMDDTGTFEEEDGAFGGAFESTATALPFGERLFESKEKETETVHGTPASSVAKPPTTPPPTLPAKSPAKPPATPPAATQPYKPASPASVPSVLGTFGGDASTSSIEPLSADTSNTPNPFLAAMPSVAVAASGAAGAGGAGAGASASAADTMAFAAPASPAAAVDVSSKPSLTLPPHTPVQDARLTNITTPLGNHGSALMERLRRRREKNQ
jgi:hypothetical protein